MQVQDLDSLLQDRLLDSQADATITVYVNGESRDISDAYFCEGCNEVHIFLSNHKNIRDLGVQHGEEG